MSQYVSKYVVCPYYSRHDGNRICCEGTEDSNTINIVFGDAKRQKEYGIRYCNSMTRHRDCMICKALDERYGATDEKTTSGK